MKHAGVTTAESMEPAKMPLFQANLLAAIETDLRKMLT